LTVHRHWNLGTRHRNRARRLDAEARAHQRALERGGAVRVGHQAIGDKKRAHVHRARGRDALTELAEASEILHRRLGPRMGDADHAMTGCQAWASTRAAIASYSARSMALRRTRSPARSSVGSVAVGS